MSQNFAFWVCVALLAVSQTAAADDDRYANWQQEASPAAAAPDANPSESAATEPEPTAWKDAPASRQRTLPVRFVRANSVNDGTRVVLASATSESEPRKLAPRESIKSRALSRPSTISQSHRTTSTSPVALVGSLGVVVGLFLMVAWAARRSLPKPPPTLPRDVLEVLGRQRISNKQEVQLMRLGNKIVLVNLMPTAVEALAEVTDPAEVDRITGVCYQLRSTSSTKNFSHMFQELAADRGRPARTTNARSAADKLDLSRLDGLDRRIG